MVSWCEHLNRGGSDYHGWSLDQLGNWASFVNQGSTQTRTANAANEITDISGTSNDPVYDSAGNMVADQEHTYTYDAWNRLVEVWTRAETPEQVAGYAYDGRNYRISKTVGETTTDYFYNDNWQILEERQGGSVTAQYVWDARYIDTPIARLRPQGETTEVHYYLTDANMNVTALVEASTGEVVERYAYDSYGKVTFLKADWSLQQVSGHADGTASAYANEILYCGYRYDPETSLYHVRNRMYQSGLGVWMQRDSRYVDGLNLFEYVRSSPRSYVDFFGAQAVPVVTVEQLQEDRVVALQKALAEEMGKREAQLAAAKTEVQRDAIKRQMRVQRAQRERAINEANKLICKRLLDRLNKLFEIVKNYKLENPAGLKARVDFARETLQMSATNQNVYDWLRQVALVPGGPIDLRIMNVTDHISSSAA